MAEDITQLLLGWGAGDRSAFDQLLPLVYDELRRLARSYLRRHPQQSVLQPTILVHEAYLKLINQRRANWQSRAQFFGLAAKVMRDLLVDYARRAQAAKRGGGNYSVSLTEADRQGQQKEFDLIALDEALDRLAVLDARHSRVVELKFFAGLTIEEIAEATGTSHATVERDWNLARAWLYHEMRSGN
jgi:RNA polymerase sigma factor (TIGR02999 family)